VSDRAPLRWLGTVVSFAVFGAGGLVLGCLVFPLLHLAPLPFVRRAGLCRRLVSLGFRSFIELMRWLGVLSYEFGATERLGKPGQLIIANHPSLIDVVFLIGFSISPCCVVKAALWRNPFTRFAVSGAGYIPNAPTDQMIDGARRALSDGLAVIMFPEGTRSTPGQPLHFHRGTAVVALSSARALTPVSIRVEPITLTKGSPWYRIPMRRPHFSLVVGDDIELETFRQSGSIPVAGRALTRHLELLFEETTMRS
jgi:1-acyl-sn-glycerol-3-phosphate acyltransferase